MNTRFLLSFSLKKKNLFSHTKHNRLLVQEILLGYSTNIFFKNKYFAQYYLYVIHMYYNTIYGWYLFSYFNLKVYFTIIYINFYFQYLFIYNQTLVLNSKYLMKQEKLRCLYYKGVFWLKTKNCNELILITFYSYFDCKI